MRGRVTIPTDINVVDETLDLMEKWGADAIRDCDGTEFPEKLKGVDAKIYATYYTTRKDNDWAKSHPEEIQQCYIMTPQYTAMEDHLEIPIMKGIYPDMMKPNDRDDIKRWWEVVDRTTGEVVPVTEWSYDGKSTVTVRAIPLSRLHGKLSRLHYVGPGAYVQCGSQQLG